MADINREFKTPAELDNPYVDLIHENLADGQVLKVKAGFLATGIPKVYDLYYCVCELVTDANVANRNIIIRVYKADAAQVFIIFNSASGNIAASTTERLIVTKAFVANAGATIANDIVGIGEMIISGDDYVEVSVNNDQAGDLSQITMQAKYLNRKLNITGI